MRTKSIKTLLLRAAPCMLGIVMMMLGVADLYADFGLPMPDVYNFGPEGRPFEAFMQDFGKPNEMMEILPGQPIAAHEKDGSRVYYTADGAVTCSVGVDGSMTFSMGSKMSKSFDTDGNLTRATKLIKGSNRVEITNGEGQVTGYQQLGYGGKVVQQFDANNNLTETFQYNSFGKTLEYVLNELSLTKTIYNPNGTPSCDIDFTGATVATYDYDSSGRMKDKTDQYGNITYYNKYGNMTYTANYLNQKLVEYNYVTDDQGRYVLDNMVNLAPGQSGGSYQGDVTYIKDGRAIETVSNLGGVAKQYYYNGTQLVYTFDTRNQQATWYDLNGNQTCTTLNGNVVQEYLYYKARMVGVYDSVGKTATLFRYERLDQTVQILQADSKPTAQQIESYYEGQGLMADIGASDDDKDVTVPTFISNMNMLKAQQSTANQQTASQNNVAFNILLSKNSDTLLSPNSGLMSSEMNYSASGQLESVVTKDANDGTGWVTTFYLGNGSSPYDRTNITVSGDQHLTPELAQQMMSVIYSGGNIGDISAGTGDLAVFAETLKSVNLSYSDIAKLSDQGLCNLMGWSINGPNTAGYIADVRARIQNAGIQGRININYDNVAAYGILPNIGAVDFAGGNRIFASQVSGADQDGFAVAGAGSNDEGSMLVANFSASQAGGTPCLPDLYVQGSGETGYVAALNNASAAQGIATSYVSQKTVNGVTKRYAANGAVVEVSDARTGTLTEYNDFGQQQAVYVYHGKNNTADGFLVQKYNYDAGGNLISMVTNNKGENGQYSGQYVTTFFMGFGNPQMGQAQVEVFGDQSNNAGLMNSLWSAVMANNTINQAAANDPSLKAFVAAISKVTLCTLNVLNMTDQQIAGIFGWNINSSNITGILSNIRADVEAGDTGGTETVTYNDGNKHVYAITLETSNGDKYRKLAVGEIDAQ